MFRQFASDFSFWSGVAGFGFDIVWGCDVEPLNDEELGG